MDEAPTPQPEPTPGNLFLIVGLATPLAALLFWLTFGSLSEFLVSTAFCINSFTLPVICFVLISNALTLRGGRRWLCWLLVLLNGGLLVWLGSERLLIWQQLI